MHPLTLSIVADEVLTPVLTALLAAGARPIGAARDGALLLEAGGTATGRGRPSVSLLRLTQGSWVAAAVHIAHPFTHGPVPPAARDLALSRLVWEEAWAGPPVQVALLYPTPRSLARYMEEARLPAALVEPGQVATLGIDAWEDLRSRWPGRDWHTVGPGPALPGLQRWPDRPVMRWRLLGLAELVVAAPGPLLWDAIRAGVPETGSGISQEASLDPVDVLPVGLASQPAVWRRLFAHAALIAANGGTVPALADPAHLAPWLARRRHRPAPPTAVFWRRARKLLRDPLRFCADSRSPWLQRLAPAKPR